jgi:4-amino-4-deoxy-L-arabinose transferase-like glycosyltransferase
VGIVEPPLLENIVAQTYRLTGEHIWIGRIYSSFFWVIAGLALFLLIREFASTSAAMVGTLFYLFVPFGVIASRAFMPDPLMVCLIIFTLWALFRWQNTSSWKWAILFGIFAGAALFVKNLSSFVIVGGFAGLDNGRADGLACRHLYTLWDFQTEHGGTICLALLPENVGRSGFLFPLGLYG